ncbi:MAG: helix-hairpin-helix domain-containing protein [Burkholderiales bacterium]|nr:helix-hairpin-helix domain-containing protein [Burkholderiales bacterium]
MHCRAICLLLSVGALALASPSTMAAGEASAAAKPAVAVPATVPTTAAKEGAATPTAKAKKPKPVDVNNASVEQLAKVPGLDKAHAMKIVAHRPYPTRAWLVTKGILSETKYAEVKDYLVATPNTSPRAPTTK